MMKWKIKGEPDTEVTVSFWLERFADGTIRLKGQRSDRGIDYNVLVIEPEGVRPVQGVIDNLGFATDAKDAIKVIPTLEN